MSVLVPVLQVCVIWWLLACALQDLRTRTVANGLTLPPFLVSLPLAYGLGGLDRVGLTLLILIFVYLLWREGSMGAADGKIATVLAAIQPGSLVLGLVVLWGLYGLLYLGWRRLGLKGRPCSLPGVVGLYLGCVALHLGAGMGWSQVRMAGPVSWP